MNLPEINRVTGAAVVGGEGWRDAVKQRAVIVARYEAKLIGEQTEKHHCCLLIAKGLSLVNGAQPHTRAEMIHHHTNGLGDESVLRIIRKPDVGKVKLMLIVAAGWIASRRDGDAQRELIDRLLQIQSFKKRNGFTF